MEKKILANYSLLRIIAIIFVISTHTVMTVYIAEPDIDPGAWHVREIIRNFALTCNGLFFMLSGRFIIEKYDGRILHFYIDRVLKIGVPALAAAAVQFLLMYRAVSFSLLKQFIRQFLSAEILGYLWFLFALMGFYLAVPFIAAPLRSLKKKEKTALIGVTLIYFAVENIYSIKKFPPILDGYPFYGYIFFCILGYLLDSIELSEKGEAVVMLAGAAGFIVSACEEIFMPGLNEELHNLAPSMVLITAGVYIAVTRHGDIVTKYSGRAVNFIARYIFFVYLLHGFAQNFLFAEFFREQPAGYGMWAFTTLTTFVLTFMLAVPVYHLLYRPYVRFITAHVLDR